MNIKKRTSVFANPSLYLLLLSNVIAIVLAIYQSWEIGTILFVYWGQSFANAFFFFFKISFLQKNLSAKGVIINGEEKAEAPAVQNFLKQFFVLHFGAFIFMYLLFILIFFKPDFQEGLPMIGIFFLNHGFSYFYNKKELKHLKQAVYGFFMPYLRNIPMHIIIAGAAIFSGAGTWAVIVFLLIKTVVDIGAHALEHYLNQGGEISMSVKM